MKNALLYAAMVTTALLTTPSTFAATQEEGVSATSAYQKGSCSKKTAHSRLVSMTEVEEFEAEFGVKLEPIQGLMGLDIDTCPQCFVVFGNTVYRIAGCYCA